MMDLNIILLTTELSKEINIEIAYNNFIEYIISFLDNKTLTSSKENIIQMFKMISQVVSDDSDPCVSINLTVQKNLKIDEKQLSKLYKLMVFISLK